MGGKKTLRVAVEAGIEALLDYRVPGELEGKIVPGMRLKVPLGTRLVTGYAVGFSDPPPRSCLRPVHSSVEDFPVFTPSMLELALELSEHYVSPPGEVFKTMLPGGGKLKKEEAAIAHASAAMKPAAWLEPVIKRCREGKGGVYVLGALPAEKLPGAYAALAAGCVNCGRQAVFLFPDSISLAAHQKVFAEKLSGMFAVYHGSMGAGRRRSVWEGARSGRLRIILGLRSAVFSPLRDPGIIIVHEESDFAYKSGRAPRLNASSAALARGRIEGFPVVLRAEFPSFETYRRLQTAEFEQAAPPGSGRESRAVGVIDMRGERAKVFSRQLKNMVFSALDGKKKVLLFSNRRGYSNYYVCKRCGYLKRCVRCSVCLRYHASVGRLLCHYCDYSEPPPEICPECGKSYFKNAGFGSQKAESLALKIFRGARVSRLDTDTAKTPEAAESVLEDFRRGRTDIMIDTGISLDSGVFENVAVCGILSADNLLNMPDFRAAENFFRFVCRAGSSVPVSASVAVQTYNPGHYAMACIKFFNRSGFYARESVIRKKLGYPPFGALAGIMISGKDKNKTGSAAREFACLLRGGLEPGTEVLGPVPAVVSRIKGSYRMQIIIKSKNPGGVSGRLKFLIGRARGERLFAGTRVTVDVDPVNMM